MPGGGPPPFVRLREVSRDAQSIVFAAPRTVYIGAGCVGAIGAAIFMVTGIKLPAGLAMLFPAELRPMAVGVFTGLSWSLAGVFFWASFRRVRSELQLIPAERRLTLRQFSLFGPTATQCFAGEEIELVALLERPFRLAADPERVWYLYLRTRAGREFTLERGQDLEKLRPIGQAVAAALASPLRETAFAPPPTS